MLFDKYLSQQNNIVRLASDARICDYTVGEKLSVTSTDSRFFQCGKIFINRRYDNHHEQLYRYCVRNRHDLEQKIVPFFRKYSLQTAKQNDFERFCQVLLMMKDKQHLSISGLKQIASLVGKKMEKESSETIRGTGKFM
jgi:hypothetical protein